MKKTALFFVILAVSGCTKNDIKSAVGLGRTSPDEFLIVTNEPLQIPQNDALPIPGTSKKIVSNKASSQEMAKAALLGTTPKKSKSTSAKLSSGDAAFLSNIGTQDKDIKSKITEDNEDVTKNIFTGTITIDVVDAEAEAQRINEAKEKGEKITGNDAKTTKAKEKPVK